MGEGGSLVCDVARFYNPTAQSTSKYTPQISLAQHR